ncbi:Hexose transporter 2 [Wallemia ichthyophaga EXF-994]|uniref:Hexose transporter 2 n=1 Tax=Wallemia ichthyophaga (strain EXF-994 / CBS 113033) TaxID=1299270 RepID=R9AE15_WALI9|nr:Hexose transporter 2 [Wallemia ichthyophaga EXF-994]EOR00422.1 Hexose transporter 2 [Wallemia ichthyophaga EXF-994]
MTNIKYNNQPLGIVSIFIAILTSVGGMIFGYDTGQISDIVLMDDFLERFSDIRTNCDPNGLNCDMDFSRVRKGLIVSLLSIGTLAGALFGAPIADYLGRRWAMTIECIVVSIGFIVQMAAFTVWQQVAVGRLIAGLGVGALSAAVPMYMSECVVASFRGTAVACYQLAITFGILLSYCFCIGTRQLESAASWRIIIGLGFVLTCTLGCGIWLLPESPRWLMKNNKPEQARHALERIRGAETDFERTVVEHDFLEISGRIEIERQVESPFWQSWVECFIGHHGSKKLVYRTLLGMMMQSLQQLTGANYFFYYGATIFQSVGLSDSFITQIILGAVNFIWLFIFASVGVARPPDQNEGMGNLMIVSACLFIASYATTWGPACWIITGETFPMRTRARQASIATASNWVWNFLIGFFSPFITGDIGFAYGYVFAGCNLFASVFVYFFLYETAGLSLEAVDEMYSTDGLKPWKSRAWTPPGYENRRDVMESAKLDTYHDENGENVDKRFEDGERFSQASDQHEDAAKKA